MALRILPTAQRAFPQIDFKHVDPQENFPPRNEAHLTILDTVQGITKPMICDIDDFQKQKSTPISPHDYDLLFHLLLLKKLKKIQKITIIAVPEKGNEEKIEEKTIYLIKTLMPSSTVLSGNAQRRTYRGQTRG